MYAPEGSFPGFGTSMHLSACGDHNMIFIDLGCGHVHVWLCVRAGGWGCVCTCIPFSFYYLALLFISKAGILIQPLLNIYISVFELMTIYYFLRNPASFNALDASLSWETLSAFYEIL